MKLKFNLLASAVIAGGLSLSTWAQPQPTPQPEPTTKLEPITVTGSKVPLGAEKPFDELVNIQIKNFQDESLGRIKDLGIDLINGRVIEVLVVSDSSLEVGNKIVAVPPLALYPDLLNEVYRLNVSTDVFKTAAAIDLTKWLDAGRSDRVAAAYRLFGQEPYFLEEGDTASKTDSRPKVSLGYVERSSKILDLPVGNLQNEQFGKVWSLTLDIPKGRIRNVVILAPGNFKTKSIVPAMALSFNATRDALLLDDSKRGFADEPRFVFTAAAFGNDAYSKEESYKGPQTTVALEQGSSYRDVDQTVRINKDIRAAKINGRNVQVGTINDRVTLRGWVNTSEDKRRIGEIAIAAAHLELVDNQITVGKPVTGN
jgi:sporulation protein YlmC with PRC-barrel domain